MGAEEKAKAQDAKAKAKQGGKKKSQATAPTIAPEEAERAALVRVADALVPLQNAWLAGEKPGSDMDNADTTKAFLKPPLLTVDTSLSEDFDEPPIVPRTAMSSVSVPTSSANSPLVFVVVGPAERIHLSWLLA